MRNRLAAILIATLALGSICPTISAQENPSPADQKRMFRKGAQLWPVYCNTCHNARPGSEKSPYEWDQVIMHMRTLGNIPPEDAQAILVYLKAR
jgi:mono/diheme cytochrome c family protein